MHWRLAAGPGFKNSCHLLNDVYDKFQRLATISDYRLDVYVSYLCLRWLQFVLCGDILLKLCDKRRMEDLLCSFHVLVRNILSRVKRGRIRPI